MATFESDAQVVGYDEETTTPRSRSESPVRPDEASTAIDDLRERIGRDWQPYLR